MYPETAMQVPGNVFYNGYMATRELLSAVERAGSTNNIKVIKQLEQLKVSAKDRMQHFDAYMGPNHQMQQTVYMATANDEKAWKQNKNDLFKIVSWAGPKEVEDAGAIAACQMESYADTATYDG
jgi:branched-chain amino acid transport system substrate-binding protein